MQYTQFTSTGNQWTGHFSRSCVSLLQGLFLVHLWLNCGAVWFCSECVCTDQDVRQYNRIKWSGVHTRGWGAAHIYTLTLQNLHIVVLHKHLGRCAVQQNQVEFTLSWDAAQIYRAASLGGPPPPPPLVHLANIPNSDDRAHFYWNKLIGHLYFHYIQHLFAP